MIPSSELFSVDRKLSRAINEAYANNVHVSTELLKQCQKLLRLNPEYDEICSRLGNDFAGLPMDIIVDVIMISQPFLGEFRHKNKRFLLCAYSNMAKIRGSWGAQARALESFEYSIDDREDQEDSPVRRTLFDESGELKTQRIAFDEVGRGRVTYSDVYNDVSIKGIASNICDYLEIRTFFDNFINSGDLQHCKLTITEINIHVGGIDRALDDFLTRQLKSRILRRFRIREYGGHVNEEWNDLFPKFVTKDDFVELAFISRGIYSGQVVERAFEKWLSSTARTNQAVFLHISQEDSKLCREYFSSSACERKTNDIYSISHPSNMESSMSVEITDHDSGNFCIHAKFSIPTETEE
ncbi:hypothetical protein QR680_013615 [Steinernema hermaphroditum]|uniref:Uncharacterized protein n=1 Tax=Steinernema hermaphroditum TaxID=289476 RepID=A0AA39I7P5_9BILA|nr:hypothetical protein QR680_013615 [Steinernema hermaphroditum]